MWINNTNDIKRFEETLDNCKDSVWIITDSGERYDLKEEREHIIGLAKMLEAEEYNEPEVFAESYADQAQLMKYLNEEREAHAA